jgi:two-component system NtrC family sensor kinase
VDRETSDVSFWPAAGPRQAGAGDGAEAETDGQPPASGGRRRAEGLIQCAELLHSQADPAATTNQLAEQVRKLVDAALVAVVLQQGERFVLHGAFAEKPGLTEALWMQSVEEDCQFCGDLTRQAITSGKLLAVTSGQIAHCPEVLAGREVLVAPLRSTRAAGALIVFGSAAQFREEEVSLVDAVTRFGGLAIANAELYTTANDRARELQQLLEISSELGSTGELDKFLEKFVVRAAEFLGFARSFIALTDGPACRVCWVAERGVARPLDCAVPEKVRARVIERREPAWNDDLAEDVAGPHGMARMFPIRQYLAVPLLGAGQRTLGLMCVVDRLDGGPVTPQDVRRAQALAAEITVMLEAARNLSLAQQHCRQAENLTATALELNSSLRLPELASKFTARAAAMLQARAALLALVQGARLEPLVFHEMVRGPLPGDMFRRLSSIMSALAEKRGETTVRTAPAAELLGGDLAAALGWQTVTLAWLQHGELIGVLALADVRQELSAMDHNLLQALAAHASVALDNARLFTRMENANRHWIEIFDSITDFIVVHDEHHNVLRVNRTLADFIGVRPAQLIGVSMRVLMSLAADADHRQPCPFCRADGGGIEEYVHPSQEHTYLVSTSHIHGPLNDGLQVIHVLKDITDRREAERRYRELFDNIQEGLFFCSPDGRFVEVNHALVRMLGYETRKELLQVDIPTGLYLTPAGWSNFEEAIAKSGGVIRNFEGVMRRRDGSLMYCLQNAFAVSDGQGGTLQYRGLMSDITELRNFQAELQRERDFSSKILNNTQSLILVVDTAGLISYANHRCYEAGNFSSAMLVGRRLLDLVQPARRDALAHALELCLLGQQVDNLELPIMLGPGRSGRFSINVSPMRDEQGQVNSVVVVMTDITDAALLQAKLTHTEKMAAVGQLVSGVAHEVNNPLTAVLGFADLLLENPEVPEPAKKDLHIILQEAQRTKQIVQNLLSFARQMPPQRSEVPLNVILRRTLALRAYDFANHDVNVMEQLDPNLPDVLGDAQQLQQVFLNILNNAYDAVRETGGPGQICVVSRAGNGFVEVGFRDNGVGISNLERIFDPFYTTKDVGKGTGLGLSICYGIIHEHGGEIACSKNPDGPGALFTVRLPIAGNTRVAGAAGGEL